MTATIIQQLVSLLQQLSNEDYNKPSSHLSTSTIGQHVRHSIEMYQCLLSGYEQAEVDYGKRKRDSLLETLPAYALQSLEDILLQLPHHDKQMIVEDDEQMLSSFKRELLYCNEHLIHHMALIKVAVLEIGSYELPAAFGIAPSTLKYRQQCAQ